MTDIDISELDSANEKVRNLEIALLTSRRIGMAMGILMARLRLTEDAAFDALRTASQRTQLKVHSVAEEIIRTGTAPGIPDPGAER